MESFNVALFTMSAVFHQAVLEGDTTKVKFILKYGQGIRVNQPNKYGLTALQQTCVDGNLGLANFLLERGADLSLVDSDGRTALHLASEQGHLDIVSLLVNSACADVNARNGCGQKAVDVASNDQVRALLSQAMLSESFKQKCSFAQSLDEGVSYEFKNVPGWRYSISSTSTDSGVSEDSSHSHDSGYDSRYPSRHYQAASYNNYTYGNPEQNNYYVTESTPHHHDQRTDKEFISARRVEPSNHAMLTKSHSFTGSRHEYIVKSENPVAADSNRAMGGEYMLESSPARYRRQQKIRKDPTRRKTVTFGENESYTISPREEQRYPKSSSLTRPTISSSNRTPLPETWKDSTTYATRFTQAGSTKEKDRRSSIDKDEGPRKAGKSKKHILSGFLEKYVH